MRTRALYWFWTRSVNPFSGRVKWDTTNKIPLVCVSGIEIFRGVTATSCSITWCLLFPKWDSCPKVGHSLNAQWWLFRGYFFCHPCIRKKKSWCGKITYKLELPKWDRCPKVGHFLNAIFSYSFVVILSSLYTWKGAQTYKKWPEMTVMGHGSIGLLQARFFCKIVLLFTYRPIQGWQNNRKSIRKHGIQEMSYFRTSVLF